MSGTITSIIGRLLIVYGFIVTALTISGIVEITLFKDIQQFAQAIFNTNCTLLSKFLLIFFQSIMHKLVSMCIFLH